MKIAVAALDKNGLDAKISQHFGRCPYFIIVNVEDGEITKTEAVENPYAQAQRGPGQVPEFINSHNVNVLISGGMGRRAVSFFEQFGIETVTGTALDVGKAVEGYLKGVMSGAEPCDDDKCK